MASFEERPPFGPRLGPDLVECDGAAFETIVGPFLDAGYALAVATLRDEDAAVDVLQEATVRAWRGFSGLRDARLARPWFLAIVANEVRRHRRSPWQSVDKRADLEATEPNGTSPFDERGLDVRQALRKLSPDDRLPLALFFYLDLPMEEVATALGTGTSAARGRVYRAVGRLKRMMGQEVAR